MMHQFQAAPITSLMTAFLFCLIFLLRIFTLIGVVALVVNKHYKRLWVSLPPVLFVTFISLCDGQSRARFAIEPILMIWTVYGFTFFKEKISQSFKRTFP